MEPSNRTAAVECCYGTPTGTQASGTPLCSPGREDKSTPVPDKLNFRSLEEWCRDRPIGDSDVLHSPSWTGLFKPQVSPVRADHSVMHNDSDLEKLH